VGSKLRNETVQIEYGAHRHDSTADRYFGEQQEVDTHKLSFMHGVPNQKDSRLAALSAGITIEGYLVGPARRSVSGVMHRRLGSRLGFTILENDHGGILCE
jgi:hypothetical protein